MSEKLYFTVTDVSFHDLYDWSGNSGVKMHPPGQTGRRSSLLMRQNSQTGTLVRVNDMEIALFKYGHKVYAVSEKCPHAGGPLHLGDIEDLPGRALCVRCPWHSWRWSLDTGKLTKPAGRDLCALVFPTKVSADGTILIGFDQFCPAYFKPECDF